MGRRLEHEGNERDSHVNGRSRAYKRVFGFGRRAARSPDFSCLVAFCKTKRSFCRFFYAGTFLSVFAAHYFTMKFGAKHIITWGIVVSAGVWRFERSPTATSARRVCAFQRRRSPSRLSSERPSNTFSRRRSALSPASLKAGGPSGGGGRVFALILGFYIPCSSLLIAKWFVSGKQSTALAVFTMGNQVGLAVSMYATAALCKVDFLSGWPLAWFAYG